ncbi:unnamed protein product [Pylaiella littoralis]
MPPWCILFCLGSLSINTGASLLLATHRSSAASVHLRRIPTAVMSSPSLKGGDVRVEVISDFACPWCYVGKARLTAAIKAFERSSSDNPDGKPRSSGGSSKVHVSYRPYMIDARTQPDGEDYLAYCERRWGGDGWTTSMKRSSRKDGCEFAKWDTWPNSLRAHRLQKFAENAGKGDQVNSLVFQTIYERGGNASDLETLVSLAEEAGLSPADTRTFLSSREGEDDVLREDHKAKAELDVRGVPYFVVRGTEEQEGSGSATSPAARGATAAAASAGNAAGTGGKGQPEIILRGAVGPDDLLRAFTSAASRR